MFDTTCETFHDKCFHSFIQNCTRFYFISITATEPIYVINLFLIFCNVLSFHGSTVTESVLWIKSLFLWSLKLFLDFVWSLFLRLWMNDSWYFSEVDSRGQTNICRGQQMLWLFIKLNCQQSPQINQKQWCVSQNLSTYLLQPYPLILDLYWLKTAVETLKRADCCTD